MTARALVFSACLVGMASAVSAAQPSGQPPAAPSPPQPGTAPRASSPAPPAREARREGQPVNVKVEVTITDQRGGTTALKKTVSVVSGDGLGGSIRSQANYSNIGDVPLNIDTEPVILADGKIRVRVNLQYDLPGGVISQNTDATGAGALRRTQIHENLSVILENGKPIVAAQSADPVSDRQVTIEVKASILR